MREDQVDETESSKPFLETTVESGNTMMATHRSKELGGQIDDLLAIPASENSSVARMDCISSCNFSLFAPWPLFYRRFVKITFVSRCLLN